MRARVPYRDRLQSPGTKGAGISSKVEAEAPRGSIRDGIGDFVAGTRLWRIWWTLTWFTIRSQYRRTYLGPWWITIQMVIFVAGLSILFGILLGQDLSTFVPYVAIGMIGFNWMIGMINGGITSITANSAAISTAPGPLSVFALRNLALYTIQFLHDAVVIVLVIILFRVPINASIVLLPLALALIMVNGIAVGLWLGPLVARYRDVGQIVTALTRILFFFTPIFWVSTDVTNQQLVVLSGWNPLAYLLLLFRDSLLGQWPTWWVVIGAILFTVANCLVALVHFSHTRERLAYWL